MIYAITDGRVHLLPEAKITWPRWRYRPIGLARKSQQEFAGIIRWIIWFHGQRSTESEVVVYSTVQGERMRPVRWTPSSIARSSFDAASLLTETPRACDGTAAKRVKALRWRSVFAGIRAGANSAKKRSETAHHRWSLLMRDLVRKLPAAITEEQRENFSLCRRVLAQKPHDNEKIYSLHEPHIYCVAKGTGAQET